MDETKKTKPRHIGFVVDGNRRWARQHNLTTRSGHKQGLDTLIDMAYAARDRQIEYVSAFVFSTENWRRSSKEVSYLMELFVYAFKNRLKKLVNDNFRIIFLGQDNHVRDDILDAIKQTEEMSKDNSGTTLALCFNYGGHAEIVDAVKRVAQLVEQGDINWQDIDEQIVRNNLYHPDLPDVDLIVRTSGEQRLSGFQLWRSAYSELLFIDKNWPDITEADLDDILNQFANRQRRFGK